MKASELINELNTAIERAGDLDVVIVDIFPNQKELRISLDCGELLLKTPNKDIQQASYTGDAFRFNKDYPEISYVRADHKKFIILAASIPRKVT